MRHADLRPGPEGLAFVDAALSWDRLETLWLLGDLNPADLQPWMDRLARVPDLSLFMDMPFGWDRPAEAAAFVNELSRRRRGLKFEIRCASDKFVRRAGAGRGDYGNPKIPKLTDRPLRPPDRRDWPEDAYDDRPNRLPPLMRHPGDGRTTE